MSNVELIAGSGEYSQSGVYLLRRLPPWMPKHEDTGNFKLLDTVGLAIDRLDNDIETANTASTVQDAETIDQLEELAKLVDLPSYENEPQEKYRSRVVAEFQTMTTEGTAADIITNAATLLGVEATEIKYTQLNENGAVSLGVPGNALDNQDISDSEFVEIITKHSAAGYRVEATVRGTFTYLSDSDYSGPYDSANGGYDNTQLSSDATLGHDGLDSNNDPKDNGGTYAGLLD